MKFDINYYFSDISSNEVFSKIIENKTNVMQISDLCSSSIIKNIENNNVKEINTDKIEENVIIKGNVYIGDKTIIQAGTVIEGPVYIGKNCNLMYNCHIRPNTIIEDNCIVGFCSEIKNTFLRVGSRVSELSFVGDSIIGKNSRVGSGVIVANRPFNQTNIFVKDENKNKIDLERDFFGIVLGDNSRLGSNCTSAPGTFIGKYCWIYPHTCIRGFVPEQTQVYDKQNLVYIANEKRELKKSNYIEN